MNKLIIITIMAVGSLGVTEVEAQYVEKNGANIFIDVQDMPAGTWSSNSLNSDHTENSPTNSLFKRFEVAKSDESGTKLWAAAKTACANRGYGWRLPTQKELQLVLIMKDMLIRAGANSFAGGGALYYTGTTFYSDNTMAFVLNMGDNLTLSIYKASSLTVRCIREVY